MALSSKDIQKIIEQSRLDAGNVTVDSRGLKTVNIPKPELHEPPSPNRKRNSSNYLRRREVIPHKAHKDS